MLKEMLKKMEKKYNLECRIKTEEMNLEKDKKIKQEFISKAIKSNINECDCKHIEKLDDEVIKLINKSKLAMKKMDKIGTKINEVKKKNKENFCKNQTKSYYGKYGKGYEFMENLYVTPSPISIRIPRGFNETKKDYFWRSTKK